ncbi:hypothetical protein JQN46_27405, partial [Enterobacter hormaechei]|uniref:hypothetical protein n=1 Tax=Enterobacter hormaechei TaxID=158836 RepID=UPI0019393B02
LKPNGHDAIGGMGRSPKARRRNAPTRHAVPTATGFEPFDHHQCNAGLGHAGHGATAETLCVRCCDQQHRTSHAAISLKKFCLKKKKKYLKLPNNSTQTIRQY